MKTLPTRLRIPGLIATMCTLAMTLAAATLRENRFLPADDRSLDGQEVVIESGTLTVAGPHRFASLTIRAGAVVTHEPATGGQADRAILITVAGDLRVEPGGRMDATGLGYSVAGSPGAAGHGDYAGGGGGHGGIGARSAGGTPGRGGDAFGAFANPASWGGPGGPGSDGAFAPGGGLIRVEVDGTLTIDGSIRADGGAGVVNNQGGGAGGGILLKAGLIRGSGSVSANGAPGEWVDGGGGAGGRVALIGGRQEFAGELSAKGAGGSAVGGAGTVFLSAGSAPGELRIENANLGEWTPVAALAGADLILGAHAIAFATEPLVIRTLVLTQNAVITHASGSTGLMVHATGNVTVGADAAITVDGRGYSASTEPGPGAGEKLSWGGSGAGHGGLGGVSASGAGGGKHYGSILQPIALGSQGGASDSGSGSAGGGTVHLEVDGTLTVNGRISANGLACQVNNAGGGAGGSLWLRASTLSGAGWIEANGGAGEWVDGGGGSGGRIALYYTAESFTGRITAIGGGGSQRGGAGTVYRRRDGESEGQLLIHNGDVWGQSTPIVAPEAFRLVLAGNAIVYPEAPLRLARLEVGTNTVLTHLTGQTNLELSVTGDAAVAAGGEVTANGKGYPVLDQRGPGSGVLNDWSGSGGGHGGLGGTSAAGAVGGTNYGSVLTPTSLGSQGGDGNGGPGNPGGGAIRLIVGGRLTVDGRLTAEGLNATANNAGGGSGGSVWLTVGTLAGTGVFSVNGGAGEWVDGGGGGGGRIALYYQRDEFAGSVTAIGGGGSQRGGAGTIYRRGGEDAVGQLLITNGEGNANYTPVSSPIAYRLILGARAYVYAEGPLQVTDLVVAENATLTHRTGQDRCEVHAFNNLTVAMGGQINVDGRGYPVGDNLGPGAGTQADWGGSGGSHGGNGGPSASGAVSALAYGSQTEPLIAGSSGGPGSGGPGAAGGGVIRLMVDKTLTVDGRISAVGLNAQANNAGGGAGGSVYITAESLAGSGAIVADGGAGEWVDGGGGAGGRIALHVQRQSFAGTITVTGGGGSARGGAGSLYTRLGSEAGGELVLDNGGSSGTLSPLDVPPSTRLTIAGGTTVYPVRSLSLVSLRLKSGAMLTHTNGQPNLTLSVDGDLTVESGATITASGKGYPVGEDWGPGAGQTGGSCGGGGGHGGDGGLAWPGDVVGGTAYDSFVEPTEFGSSGGSGGGPANARSPGGGAIRLIVGGLLTVDGSLAADGLSAWYNNQGGGAGGSLWITAAKLAGGGTINANGGIGEWVDGGGGSGGRIALHLGTDEFKGSVAARGGGGHQAGAAGTIYTRVGSAKAGSVLVDNGDQWGGFTPLRSEEPYHLTLAHRAQAFAEHPLVLGSLNAGVETVLTHLKGQEAFSAVVLGDAVVAGTINVDGRGYPVGGEVGPGAGSRRDWSGSGAGHGGVGGRGATGIPGGVAYGSALEPSTHGSQGGSGEGGAGGHGGGAVRLIVGGRLTLDGAISANGINATANNAGGGSGGSIFLGARELSGAGTVAANGGAGEWVDGGGGSGGRIAVYRVVDSFTGVLSATGAGGSARGEDGTIHQDALPKVAWLSPSTGWLHGEVDLQVALFTGQDVDLTTEFSAWRGDRQRPIGNAQGRLTASVPWNTVIFEDGPWQIQAVARDPSGRVVSESRRDVLINNAVRWHGGALVSDETWDPGMVHVVLQDLVIPAGTTLTLSPGVVVKVATGVRLELRSGSRVVATGTAALPVSVTSLLDDTLGGDSNLDGDATRPIPGAWRLSRDVGAELLADNHTRLRFLARTFGGTLAANETWTADSLVEVSETVVVPGAINLRIEGGAIVKFSPGAGIDVRSGGALVVAGTQAQPVVLTSRRDDAYGGDTNDDGSRSAPAAGDWRSIQGDDGSTLTLDHAWIRFGGDSRVNQWGAGGAIEGGGRVTARNCVISDALKDGVFCWAPSRFENCLILRCDRGLTAVAELQVVHCTIDSCRIGLLEHVGQLIVRNSIVSRSIDVGISHDLGGATPVVTFCNVWNPDARQGNYAGTSDRTGLDGNISDPPAFKDADADNFRLHYASPGIDAADGTVAPTLDLAGAPRYDDPRTGNTGTASSNGAVPDMGAFEFAETAPSDINLVVSEIRGPGAVVAGDLVHVEWTIQNRGTEAFTGPWHDALYLENSATRERLFVGEVLAGRSAKVGPGQSWTVGADVHVPGGLEAAYRWVVAANSRGDVFEGVHAADNETAASVSSTLTVPTLPLDGTSVTGAFGAQEQAWWFQVRAPLGKDVRFDLDLLADRGITELYVGRGFVPTPEAFSARHREFGSADTTAIASGQGASAGGDRTNIFYVMVLGRSLETVPVGFALDASTAPFSVDAAANGIIGNAGEVTLEIHGSGFGPDTEFSLRRGGQQRSAIRQSVRESGRAFATFDAIGLAPGTYDLAASLGGVAVSQAGAVEVRAGGTPDFYVNLSGPGTTRAGRLSTWFVTYGNRGLVDLRLPLLKVSAPGATEIQLFDSTLNWADAFTYLALNPDVLLPTLGPGQEVTFEFRLKTMNPVDVSVDWISGEDLSATYDAFDWASLPRPTGATADAWQAYLARLPERLGVNVAEFQSILEADLVDLAASELRYAYLANVNGRWLFGKEPVGVPAARPIIPVPDDYVTPETGLSLHALKGGAKKLPGDGIKKTWWVVLTIEDYQKKGGTNVHNLPGTARDFEDVADFAVKDLRTPAEQTSGFHDGPAQTNALGLTAFMLPFAQLIGKVDADDNLVVVYSGHGGRKSDGSPFLALNGGFLAPEVFSRLINNIGAGTTYFVNDSCHSGAFNAKVNTTNSTFVGLAATAPDKVSFDTASGGELITGLKANLRRCNGLGKSFELTAKDVTERYKSRTNIVERQEPVLTNPNRVDLEGKPWGEPSGFGAELRRKLNELKYKPRIKTPLNIVGSVDPNDKYALAGVGPLHWVQPDQVLPFEVLFENKTNAAAPAQEVLVVDDLDPRFDWSTFELKSIAFNDARIVVPPGLQRFTTTTKVSTDSYAVSVQVDLDPATGRITWLLRSLDPTTGDLPEDPFAGFLPPNDATHRGEGVLSYTVRPKAGLPDGTQLTNRATIVFDPTYGANPPILTPWVTNTLDSVAPTSQVQSLPTQATGEVPVQWDGAEVGAGSGLASFDLFVSKDDGPYEPWLIATSEKAGTFTGLPGSTYRFYSVARDLAGNTEAAPTVPDAVITLGGGSNFATWANTQ
ncbi:MAG: hypothetical protein JNK85_20925, partial [Verrucomicrobiales bacterium]|nr:hypothetical protein [Verrucomicrobiales bacterium]